MQEHWLPLTALCGLGLGRGFRAQGTFPTLARRLPSPGPPCTHGKIVRRRIAASRTPSLRCCFPCAIQNTHIHTHTSSLSTTPPPHHVLRQHGDVRRPEAGLPRRPLAQQLQQQRLPLVEARLRHQASAGGAAARRVGVHEQGARHTHQHLRGHAGPKFSTHTCAATHTRAHTHTHTVFALTPPCALSQTCLHTHLFRAAQLACIATTSRLLCPRPSPPPPPPEPTPSSATAALTTTPPAARTTPPAARTTPPALLLALLHWSRFSLGWYLQPSHLAAAHGLLRRQVVGAAAKHTREARGEPDS